MIQHLGRDGRKLSAHQSRSWMVKIAANRKYKNAPLGEKSGRAKLTADDVRFIRRSHVMPRRLAKSLAKSFGITWEYVYQLRSPNSKTWKWLSVVLLACLNGCVSIGTHKREVREAFIGGMQKARAIAYRQHCEDAVKIINGKIETEEMKR